MAFLSNGRWEQAIKDHIRARQLMELMEEEGEGSLSPQSTPALAAEDNNSADDEDSSGDQSATRRAKLADQQAERAKEQALLAEKLTQLITRLHDQKFTQIVPGAFDADFLHVVPNLRILPSNANTVALQTTIRDRNSPRENFVFNADRLIRLVIEEGLNQLPSMDKTVITPTGGVYPGVEFLKSNCGISIVRSGEAMEKALRDCCRSIRIGKILIQSDEETHIARVLYAKLPADISLRKVLLLYPIMSTGNTVVKAIKVLKKNGVKETNIILINLFTTPVALRAVATRFSELTIQTTEVHPIAPLHFGQKYFGTD